MSKPGDKKSLQEIQSHCKKEKFPMFDELLNHKELLVKSLSELSEENLCKLGEVLSMLLFRQDFIKFDKGPILKKVATKSNPVFIDCL